MLPYFPLPNEVDRVARDAVEASKIGAAARIGKDGPNIRLGELGHSILLPFGLLSAPFGKHVAHVVTVGAERQMLRIYAGRRIARVKNVQAIGNWTVCKSPRKAMSKVEFSSPSKSPVPEGIFVSIPENAAIRGWVAVVGNLCLYRPSARNVVVSHGRAPIAMVVREKAVGDTAAFSRLDCSRFVPVSQMEWVH